MQRILLYFLVLQMSEAIVTAPKTEDSEVKSKETKEISQLWANSEVNENTLTYDIEIPDLRFTKILEEALETWETNTCVKFERKEKASGHEDADTLIFRPDDRERQSFCSAWLNILDGRMETSCHEERYVLQSVGLLLGLPLEELHPRASEYLVFSKDYQNFINKKKTSQVFEDVPFDFTSIMMSDMFAIDTAANYSIIAKDIKYQGLIGRTTNRRVTFRDILKVNRIFKCFDVHLKACKLRLNPCRNNGFIGRNCTCVCPPNVVGEECESTVGGGYYGNELPSCSRDITLTSQTSIKIPYDEDTRSLKEEWCAFKIRSPKGTSIKVTLLDWDVKKEAEHCRRSFLEIREQSFQDHGKLYCGNDIRFCDEFVSRGNELSLYMDVKNRNSKGFFGYLKIQENPEETGLIECKDVTAGTPDAFGESLYNLLLSKCIIWLLVLQALMVWY